MKLKMNLGYKAACRIVMTFNLILLAGLAGLMPVWVHSYGAPPAPRRSDVAIVIKPLSVPQDERVCLYYNDVLKRQKALLAATVAAPSPNVCLTDLRRTVSATAADRAEAYARCSPAFRALHPQFAPPHAPKMALEVARAVPAPRLPVDITH